MEQVPDPNSLTREALVMLNGRSMEIEDVRDFFNVDMEYLKARMLQENMYVWESPYGRVRIHMGDTYKIIICLEKLRIRFAQSSITPFKQVISNIEIQARLSPGSYKLICKFPSVGDVLVETDRDWHFAVEYCRENITGNELYVYLVKTSVRYPSASDVINLSHNWMEQVPASSKQPFLSTQDSIPESMWPSYIRSQRELIRRLNDGSHTFEGARSLLNVELEDFKKFLLQEIIYVWNDLERGPVRIHTGDYYVIHIFIKKLRKSYDVGSTVPFKQVVSMIERDLKVSPGSYNLKHSSFDNRKAVLKTNHDWHYAVELSREKGIFDMYLDLKKIRVNKKCKKSE